MIFDPMRFIDCPGRPRVFLTFRALLASALLAVVLGVVFFPSTSSAWPPAPTPTPTASSSGSGGVCGADPSKELDLLVNCTP